MNDTPKSPSSERAALWRLVLFAVTSIGLAIFVFLQLVERYRPTAPGPATTAPHPPMGEVQQAHQQQVVDMVERLASRLRNEPDNGPGWSMLARSYMALGRHEEAMAAFAKAVKLQPNDANTLADYADAMGVVRGRSLGGEPIALVLRALAIDPDHVKALALAGTEAYGREDYQMALKYWRRAVERAASDSEWKETLNGSIADAEGMLARQKGR